MASVLRRTTAHAFWLLLVAACSGAAAGADLNGSSFGEDAGSADGGTSSFPIGPTDGGGFLDGSVQDAGPVSCTPALPASFAPAWVAPVEVAAACTGDELGMYYDTCAPDPQAAQCTTWMSAHKKCVSCLEGPNNGGPIQVYRDRYY